MQRRNLELSLILSAFILSIWGLIFFLLASRLSEMDI